MTGAVGVNDCVTTRVATRNVQVDTTCVCVCTKEEIITNLPPLRVEGDRGVNHTCMYYARKVVNASTLLSGTYTFQLSY